MIELPRWVYAIGGIAVAVVFLFVGVFNVLRGFAGTATRRGEPVPSEAAFASGAGLLVAGLIAAGVTWNWWKNG